jgi:hypothetical protein
MVESLILMFLFRLLFFQRLGPLWGSITFGTGLEMIIDTVIHSSL